MSLADFSINADATNQGFDGENNEVLTFALRTIPANGIRSWVLQTFDNGAFALDDPIQRNPPRQSKGAPELSLVGAATGQRVSPTQISGSITCTLPATGSHSWILRSIVNGGIGPDGRADPSLIVQRMVVIRDSVGNRKIIATERTEYEDDGWAGAISDLMDSGVLADDDHGLDVTGVLDSTAALQALVQPDDRTDPSGGWDNRIVVNLPTDARIRISSQIQITRSVHIIGNGARIFCDLTGGGLTDMFRIQETAPFTKIEGLKCFYEIASVQLQDNDKIAFKVEAHNFQFESLDIDGCGYGFIFDTENETYNLNHPSGENTWIRNVRRQGVVILGVDTSGGVFNKVRVLVAQNHFDKASSPQVIGGHGVANGFGPAQGWYLACANDVTLEGCSNEVCDEGGVIQPRGGVGSYTFLGHYSEDSDGWYWRPSPDSPFQDFTGNTVIIGGALSFISETRGDRIGCRSSRLSFRAKNAARMSGIPTLTYTDVGAGGTIHRDDADENRSWIIDGFQVLMDLTNGGTISNNWTGQITGVTADTLSFTTAPFVNETVLSPNLNVVASGIAYAVFIPDPSFSSALSFRAEDSAASQILLKFDGTGSGVERWDWMAYLHQSKRLAGFKVTASDTTSFGVRGEPEVQIINGSGAWNGTAQTIFVTGSGARTITFPNPSHINTEIEVIDAAGNASTDNITLNPDGATTINAAATVVINTDWGGFKLKYLGSSAYRAAAA